MLNIKNAIVSQLTLQRVGHKIREEQCLFTEGVLALDEREDELFTPFFQSPFKKQLDPNKFQHYSGNLEYHLMHDYCKKLFNHEMDFVQYSQTVLEHLFEKSTHPQIKSGEVFMVHFGNIRYNDEVVEGIGIYKLENKKRFLRFDYSAGMDFFIHKGYKLEGIDKACLILNIEENDGYRVYSHDDNQVESEYWKKNFLEIDLLVDNAFHTKNYINMLNEFSMQYIQPQEGKKASTEFIGNGIQLLNENEYVTDFILEDQLLEPYKVKEEFKQFRNDYAEQTKTEVTDSFDVYLPTVNQQKKKIKTEIKLDTDIMIKLDINKPESSEDFLERGFDEEKNMFYYKVFFNSEE